ncbi:MAG TPA: glycoside hydrolase family 25 protein [Thermoanaerobaculia bacterium]|jgi:lysozyme
MIDVVIDISHFQGSPDFGTVASSGIVGVIHKATQGTGSTDATYASAKTSALAAGLLWGAYHFGTGASSGADQADYFLNVVKPQPHDLIAVDFEPNPSGTSMDLAQLLDFIETVQKSLNRWPVVYGGNSLLFGAVGKTPNATLAACPLWVAEYTSALQPIGIPTQIWPKWTLWQYTESGNIPGITTKVDRDRFNGTEAELRAWW